MSQGEVDEDDVILDQTPQYLLLDEVVTLSSEEDEVVVNARNLVDVHPKEDAAEEEHPLVE